MVTSAQLRAARGLMNWTVRDLAEKAGVHRNTITRAETEATEHGHAVAAVVRALESAGVIFVAENGDGPGVRLRRERVAVRYDASHLHLLWDRAGALASKEMPDAATVVKVENGLVCRGSTGEMLGSVSLVDGLISIDPPVEPSFPPDRLAPVDLERWLEGICLWSKARR